MKSISEIVKKDSFISLAKEAWFEQEIKKSVFIAHAKPVKSVEEAEAFIADEWNKYKDSTHIVYAWSVGKELGNIQQRFSDNGEPQGTSGPPVFDVLDKNSIHDAIITVTRYYGGTLLGTGGLVKAYGSSASGVVKNARLVQLVPGIELVVNMPYSFNDTFNYRLDLLSNQVNVLDRQYTSSVFVKCIVDLSFYNEFIDLVNEISSRTAEIEIRDNTYQAKPIDYLEEE